MTSYGSIVAGIQDRISWWAEPPERVRPSPALAGWTLEEWVANCAVLETSHHESFKLAFPARVEMHGHDPFLATKAALQNLVAASLVEVCPNRPDAWRVRDTNRFRA